MNGILIVDKPQNYTSFDVVAVLRKLSKQRKIGHCGTLDPMATGVLPLLLGKATRAQSLLTNSDKKYLAEFRLGITTNTQDITGKLLLKRDCKFRMKHLLDILPNFTGDIGQLPPMFSAIKKNGKKLYDLARKGIEIERDARSVTIKKLILIEFNENTQSGKILVNCSKGTYIRTLCADIGEYLGCGATLTSLRRTAACGFDLEQCLSLSEVRRLSELGELQEKLLSIDSLFTSYNRTKITEAQSIRFKNGGPLSIPRTDIKLPKNGEIFRVYNDEDIFLGLGIINLDSEELRILRLFCERD